MDDRGVPVVCVRTSPGQGVVVGFDPSGTEVARANLAPIASDLSAATVTSPAGIARVLVVPAAYLYYSVEWALFEGTTPPALSVSIEDARGPNPGGSFTTLTAESSIQFAATTVPDSFATRVHWVVQDEPGDAVATATSSHVADGSEVSFRVPKGQDLGRMRAPHLAPLDHHALALQATAEFTTDDGQVVSSAPVTIRQDEIDTMREEYVELKVSHGVPAWEDFIPTAPDTYQNRGDYNYAILQPAFMEQLAMLQATIQPVLIDWQVNGIYRNPAHNRYHADNIFGDGPSSGAAPNSWHQYGCAADIQTFPAPREDEADRIGAILYWHDLAAAAREMGFDVEPFVDSTGRYGSGVGHVHLDLCPQKRRP